MTQESKSKVTRIHHIGVTVNDAHKAVAEWKEAFGFEGKVVDIPEVGEGISHIAFETTDLEYMVERAKKAGMRLTTDKPKDALEGICSFVVPEDARIRLEFMQPVEGRENPLA